MDSKGLISVLIEFSKSDRYFDQYELAYIIKVGKHIGMEDDEVEHMIKHSEKAEIEIPSSERERLTILYYLLFLMKIDTEVTQEERNLIIHYGFKFGFSHSMTTEFINLVESHRFKKIPPEKMMAVIKKYSN